MSKKKVEHRNIQPPSRKSYGVEYQYKETDTYHADVTPGESVRLFGVKRNYANQKEIEFDRTFKIGDIVEYDSWNLSYTGEIIAITPKTVLVESHGQRYRMNLWKFSWRNWNFNLQKTAERNADTMMRI